MTAPPCPSERSHGPFIASKAMSSFTDSSQAHGAQSEEIQAAIANAVELRSLHAALLQRSNHGSPAVLGAEVGDSPSALRCSNPLPAAEEYPVFTPNYDEDSLRGYKYISRENRSLSETWRAIRVGRIDEETNLRGNEHSTPLSEQNICFRNEHFSRRSSCSSHILQATPVADVLNISSRRTSSAYETITTFNSWRPAANNRECQSEHKNLKMTYLHGSELPIMHERTKQRERILSWLFLKSKKKPNPGVRPNPVQSDDKAQIFKDPGLLLLESLKKELLEANKSRDAALAQVSEMRYSLGELQQKLVILETYCEELKQALKQAKHAKNSHPIRASPNVELKDFSLPVDNEVMAEGFLQMVSEARLAIKQFCKMLIHQLEESDSDLMETVSMLLQPHRIVVTSSSPKLLLYHVEALINQSLYQEFENCVFQKNGSPKFLDPHQDRHHNFQSFVALRNLSWNEVLRKGTSYYSEDFSSFCDHKMSCIVSLLSWVKPWPQQLLQCFFVAAKCIWLLHLLAFSFCPPLAILRVVENQTFDPMYMEDALADRRGRVQGAVVQIMVMPGFYIRHRVMKCRVLCRH